MSKKTYHSISIPSECLSDIDIIKFFNNNTSPKEFNTIKALSFHTIATNNQPASPIIERDKS